MSNGSSQSNDLISAFHDGELAEHDRKAAEQLLEDSADCRAELEDYRALSELMRELPAVPAPEGLRAAVMRRIERHPRASSVPAPASKPRGRWRFKIALVATALTAAAALLVIFVQPDHERNLPIVVDLGTNRDSAAPATADSPNAIRELAELPADASLALESLDALGSTGGVAAAGAAARPPEGFSIGDVYTYLEQTPEGDVMVVNAVVVDVRRALDQLQVLLSKSEIPTVSVAVNENDGDAFGFGGAAAAGTPAGDATQEVALYVESDPDRINAALASLGKEEEFLSWRYAGVLDESQPAARMSMLSYYSTPPAPDAAEPATADTLREMERAEAAASGAQPAARGSVTDRAFRRASEDSAKKQEILPQTPARDIPFGQSAPAGGAGAEVEMKQDVAEGVDVTNGYQTILNVPRAALEEQLTVSNATSEPAEFRAARRQDSAREADEVERDMKLAEETREQQFREALTRDRRPSNAVPQLQQQQQRRLRLLFVLEPEPMAGTAAKVKADRQQQNPVEAPLPARKKG